MSLKNVVKTALTFPMSTMRSHLDPRCFGRRSPFVGEAVAVRAPSLSDDLKLFVATYFAGFLAVSIFLA
jgi:hypothetical protein